MNWDIISIAAGLGSAMVAQYVQLTNRLTRHQVRLDHTDRNHERLEQSIKEHNDKLERVMGFTKKVGYYDGPVWEWNLPTGSTCPAALQCKVSVDRLTGKFKAEHKAYRCYAANAKRFPGVRESRWRNFEASRRGELPELPKGATAVRIHAARDFYNQEYFDLWLDYARNRPGVEFWAYTKSLRYWVKRKHEVPANLLLTASYGGREDSLIKEHGLRWVKVYKSPQDVPPGLPIDTNDQWARTPGVNFALIDNFA